MKPERMGEKCLGGVGGEQNISQTAKEGKGVTMEPPK
jgi:hypothetical protein